MANLAGILCQHEPNSIAAPVNHGGRVALACLIVGLSIASPKSAEACTIARPQAALVGYPADGQADIPTDVVPFYDLSRAGIADGVVPQFELKSAGGAVIAVAADKSHVWHIDVAPAEPLEANTEYRLDVTVPGERVTGVTFTTGDGPFEDELQPPKALLQHYQFSPGTALSSCGPPQTGSCVAFAGDLPVEATFLWNGNVDGSYVYLYQSSFFTNLSGIQQGTPFDCVSLRARAPNGGYSAPVQLCRDDGELLTLNGGDGLSCTPEGLVQQASPPAEPRDGQDQPAKRGDGTKDEDTAAPTANANDGVPSVHESTSCSFAAPRASSTWPGFGFLLAALLRLRRRRR